MAKGTVKFFSEKGFGFIIPEFGGPELYFHKSGIKGLSVSISAGTSVEYRLEVSDRGRGPIAVDVWEIIKEDK